MEKKVKSKKNQRCLYFICWQAMCWHESSLRYIKAYEKNYDVHTSRLILLRTKGITTGV